MAKSKSTLISLSVVIAIIIAVAIVGMNRCTPKPEKIRIGYLPITLSLPFFVAIEKGYFKDANVDVEAVPYTTADQLTNALLAGNLEMTANTSLSTFFTTVEESPDFAKIFMISIHDAENFLDALLVKSGSSIKRAEDLKGKKIGVFPGSTNVVYLSIALSKYLNPKTDVTMIQIPPQTHIEALASGQIDALYTLEPLVTAATLAGTGQILMQGLNATYIVNPFPGGAYLVSTDFYSKHNQSAVKVKDAINRAVDFIRSNEPEARGYFEKYTPIKGDIAQKTHIGAWWKLDEVQKNKTQELANILYENQLMKNHISVDTYFLP